jgi:broad specificity phosphatase PhoE
LRLYWIRHGETEWNRTYRLQGTSDVPLNEQGLLQAQQVHRGIHEPLTHIFCSPLSRTREFAIPLGLHYNLEPTILPELQEMSFGRWEGQSYAEMNPEDQQALITWSKAPHSFTPPEGESLTEVAKRIRTAIEQMEKVLPADGAAAVVTHGGVIRVMVTLVLSAPLSAAARMQFDPASISVIENNGDGWKLTLLNGVCHLR